MMERDMIVFVALIIIVGLVVLSIIVSNAICKNKVNLLQQKLNHEKEMKEMEYIQKVAWNKMTSDQLSAKTEPKEWKVEKEWLEQRIREWKEKNEKLSVINGIHLKLLKMLLPCIEDNNAESEMARIKQVEEILSAYMKEIEEKLQK